MKEKIIFLTAIVFLISTASALQFGVEIGALTDSSEYGTEYRNNTAVQQINTTILNAGSVGCEFRLKGEFEYANQTQIRYSSPYALFPGSEAMMQLYFIPENYTGQVDTTLYSEYCGQEKLIKEFNFSSPESVVSNNTMESITRSVGTTSSIIDIESENGRFVPKEAPAYWKVGSADIVNGTATIEYDAPIFREGENLTYTVLDSRNNIVGETEVYLKAENTLIDRLEENLYKILFGVSAIFNLIFVILRLRDSST
jgi:hypothetical protein